MFRKISFYLFLFISAFSLSAKAQDLSLLLGEAKPKIQDFLKPSSINIDRYELETAELKRFYSLRENKPVWNLKEEDSSSNFIKTMGDFIFHHGLNEHNYPSHSLLEKLAKSQKEEDKTKLEILITHSLLLLAHEMHGDLVNLAQLYPGWDFKREPFDAVSALEKAIKENKVYEFIEGLAPQSAVYKRLTRELENYRKIAADGGWKKITTGPTLEPGAEDPRVSEVRARLAAEGYSIPPMANGEEKANPNFYDDSLRAVVEDFQARNGLAIDGKIGLRTTEALNIAVEERINQIIANMERWRHMPSDFPSRYVVVNIAAATIDLIDGGRSVYHGPVVVGRPDRKTPFINSSIRSIIFNPAWHVPQKIARKDILPKLRKDPHYLEKMGFVISGSADDPHGFEIDWDSIEESEFHFRLRQSPGELNSLGRIKFDFDNKFSVYMHGTPHQELFEKPDRNKSSGCVRVRDPNLLAAMLLAKNEGDWSEAKVQEEIDKGRTRWLAVTEPLPVLFVYWSVFPADNDGPLNFRKDVYRYDEFLIETIRKNKISLNLNDSET